MNLGEIREKPAIASTLAICKRYSEDGGGYLAAIISHYGFLSIFPMILVAAAVIGIFLAGDPVGQQELILKVAKFFPGLADAAGKNLDSIVRRRTSVGVFGLLALTWTGIGAVEASTFALGKIYRFEKDSKFLKQKAEAILGMVGLGSVTLVSVVLATAIGSVRADGALGLAVKAAAVVLAFGLDLILFLIAYRVLIPGRGPKIGHLWAGAFLGAAGWTGLKVLGGWYVRRSVEVAGPGYGSFATVVGILALLYVASKLFVFGAEVNAFRHPQHPGEGEKKFGKHV